MSEQAFVEFSGERVDEEVLAWGQHSIWLAIARNPPGRFVVPRILVVPDGAEATVPATLAALGRVIGRHEALRSNIVEDPDGPRQVVRRSGRLPVSVLAAGDDPQATALRQARQFRTWSFDHATEFPLRVAVVTAGTRVVRIVLAFSHVAADWRATDVIFGELRALLTGADIPGPPPLQPVDIARRERKAELRRAARAQSYWSEQYRRIPPTMFSSVGAPAEPVCQAVQLESPALHGAARVLAARNQVSTSTVLLVAAAALVGLRANASLAAMSVVVHNRFRPERRGVVTTLNQLGLLVLDLTGEPGLADLVRRGWHASMLANRNAYYDEVVMRAHLERVSADRGTVVNPFCCFNDLRNDVDRIGRVPSEAEVRAVLGDTRLTTMAHPRQSRCRFCLVVMNMGGVDKLQLTANTEYLPAGEITRFLLGIERVVVAGAFRDAPVSDLLTPAR